MHDSPVQARCSDEDSKACLSIQHLCTQSPVAFLLFSCLGGTGSLCFWTSKWIHPRGKIRGPWGPSLLQNAVRDCVLLVTHCKKCNASSCMSARCKNSSSALMRMNDTNEQRNCACGMSKAMENRLVAATFYSSRMGLSSALIQHTSQGLRVCSKCCHPCEVK